ncbi:beta-lactamase FAR-1 [Actinomyces sp. oral taxon 448 str. F0400]|nr:beta-lactamase FAR-1 [Actinomyces sp. oral taxon 448 str. F0400]
MADRDGMTPSRRRSPGLLTGAGSSSGVLREAAGELARADRWEKATSRVPPADQAASPAR